MGMNPAAIMKLLEGKRRFDDTHPKVSRFLGDLMRNGVKKGDVIDVVITRPDGSKVSTNMMVQDSDLELIESLKDLGRMM